MLSVCVYKLKKQHNLKNAPKRQNAKNNKPRRLSVRGLQMRLND